MKIVSAISLFFFLAFGWQGATAQTITFKTSSVSYTERNERGKWGQWSDFVKADLVISIDGKKKPHRGELA